MIYKVFGIFDVKVGAFLPNFLTVRSKGEAVRILMNELSGTDSNFCKHPNDYVLTYLSDFDDAEGIFDTSGKELVGTFSEFVEISDSKSD